MTAALPESRWTDAQGHLHHGPVLHQVNGFDVVDCAHCGWRHALPLPSPADLQEVYAHEYYSSEKPLYIQHYLEDQAWWDRVYAERLDRLEAALPAARRRLLDVGSGPGLFLAAAAQRGWTPTGIEPSVQAARHSIESLGLDVRNQFLTSENAGALGQFDVVNMGEVLEHLPDPAGMLAVARGLLAPGGWLVLVVPNDYNPIQRVLHDEMGVAPWWVGPPHHLNYFDTRSLAALVGRCGFEVQHQETTFPIDLFLLMGHHYIGDDTKGRQAHAWRKTLEQNLYASAQGRALMGGLREAFGQLGVGREVVLFARRTDD